MIFEKYRVVLGRHGLKNRVALMVLYAMCEHGYSYWRAVAEVAAFYGRDKETEHSSLCYWVLAAGIETPLPALFKKLVAEVEIYEKEEADENGIHA